MILYYLLAAVLIAIDQMVKWKIVQNFSLYDELEVIPEFFYPVLHSESWSRLGNIAREDGVFFSSSPS